MARWSRSFFIVALIAAIFGFAGIATSLMPIGKIMFYIFIALFLLSVIFGKLLDRL